MVNNDPTNSFIKRTKSFEIVYFLFVATCVNVDTSEAYCCGRCHVATNHYSRAHPTWEVTAKAHRGSKYYNNRPSGACFGILDDMLVAGQGDVTNRKAMEQDNAVQEYFEYLFQDLIFSSNMRRDITRRLTECTDPGFLKYLEKSADSTSDEEERQGLVELLEMIKEIHEKVLGEEKVKAVAKESTTLIIETDELSVISSDLKVDPLMTNAEVLKRANQINKAVAAAALSDDEKPSDFISDCREVVNLSRGFNNRGQMRVGGR